MHRNTYYKNRYNKISVVKKSIKNIKNTYKPNMKHLKTLISISIIHIHDKSCCGISEVKFNLKRFIIHKNEC